MRKVVIFFVVNLVKINRNDINNVFIFGENIRGLIVIELMK